ncbi:hypothetical protein HD593_006509 [Nonomuraea rubra]|uniref:Uncharacterized protein n=1 Tax=Nonomuraea rubra TaxID=46180 RepID=A0A7X0U1R4_9ACTN|nr:hypothetical protein [Nonomuraea rubra]
MPVRDLMVGSPAVTVLPGAQVPLERVLAA